MSTFVIGGGKALHLKKKCYRELVIC